jgi:hypothetical protein
MTVEKTRKPRPIVFINTGLFLFFVSLASISYHDASWIFWLLQGIVVPCILTGILMALANIDKGKDPMD